MLWTTFNFLSWNFRMWLEPFQSFPQGGNARDRRGHGTAVVAQEEHWPSRPNTLGEPGALANGLCDFPKSHLLHLYNGSNNIYICWKRSDARAEPFSTLPGTETVCPNFLVTKLLIPIFPMKFFQIWIFLYHKSLKLNKSSSCYFLFLVDCLASFVSLFSQCKFELSKTPKFYHARSYLYPLHISLAFTFHTTLLLLTCFLASSSPGK